MVTSLKLADVVAGALGLPAGTVVQHLRNLQKDKRISYIGRGRGAAQMEPGDAARLLIAAVGSDLVKDSVATLDAFGSLLPIATRVRPFARNEPAPQSNGTFADQLAGLLAKMSKAAAGEFAGSRPFNVGFQLMSVAGGDTKRLPYIAISGLDPLHGITFASQNWYKPVSRVQDFAVHLRGSGLIRVKVATLDALLSVAKSL
ncbi:MULTISPECIES: hypothetical protein [Bradyrhizobium]|uniref:hypothetical protein n=1 Tax=Bradyrhizobium TaxID=374 RepID=UPI0004AF25E5|nr:MULTISPECIES: hypothetical protein [Bradyrhizobium]MCP1761150.1 hypothetical protein [Bradyrhizobium japonicum]MCP1792729.1 hypothetical protein [Bradyrhizobium japonicum]MCP1805164.1 hypothetical protein [Bradyrhizobium japonicum]MCP1814181.1 hypothetical protein [Bradyrhizobium japonicum]MCP1874389.1 hypothetical protein [Bradyrhizobium japonicum]